MNPTELLIDTRETVARIETKVDFLIEQAADHEKRIRSNERWRWGIPGGALMAAVLAVFG